MTKKQPLKQWRMNYIVDYFDNAALHLFQGIILETLKNVALLQEIQCVVVPAYTFSDGKAASVAPKNKEPLPDLVYFRSSPRPTISRTEFERMLAPLFGGLPLFGRVEVGRMLMSELPRYPFPEP